jgi:hypothetical protein
VPESGGSDQLVHVRPRLDAALTGAGTEVDIALRLRLLLLGRQRLHAEAGPSEALANLSIQPLGASLVGHQVEVSQDGGRGVKAGEMVFPRRPAWSTRPVAWIWPRRRT